MTIPTKADFALVEAHVVASLAPEARQLVTISTRYMLAMLVVMARFQERDTVLALVEKHCCQCRARQIASALLADGASQAVHDRSGAIVGFTDGEGRGGGGAGGPGP